jgi:hypothetical protein
MPLDTTLRRMELTPDGRGSFTIKLYHQEGTEEPRIELYPTSRNFPAELWRDYLELKGKLTQRELDIASSSQGLERENSKLFVTLRAGRNYNGGLQGEYKTQDDDAEDPDASCLTPKSIREHSTASQVVALED